MSAAPDLESPQSYVVRFAAVVDDALDPAAAQQLTDALRTMPGIDAVDRASVHAGTRRVAAGFRLEVRTGGMGDAARGGSRLAKEALRAAGMDQAQLVQLVIELDEQPPGAAPR